MKIRNILVKKGKTTKPKGNKLSETYFISAFPKSGSSFISLVLADLLKYQLVDIVYSHFREQDLYLPKMEGYKHVSTISKHHTLATVPNIDILKDYCVKPVVLVRNLHDVVISLRDHISKTLRWPHFDVPFDFNEWEESRQFDFLIDLAIPWYIHFYVSWKKQYLNKKMDILFINYEDFNKNPLSVFKTMLEFLGHDFQNQDIEKSIEKVKLMAKSKNRINKGVLGRGEAFLTPSQKERILDCTGYYPDIDFKEIL